MNLITENSKNVFYLKNSVKTLSKRLLNEKKDRPILSEFKTLNKIEEFVSKHLFERMFFYNKASHIIDSEKWGIKKNVYEIIKILNQ
jgi:shikimate kinase